MKKTSLFDWHQTLFDIPVYHSTRELSFSAANLHKTELQPSVPAEKSGHSGSKGTWKQWARPQFGEDQQQGRMVSRATVIAIHVNERKGRVQEPYMNARTQQTKTSHKWKCSRESFKP